MSRAPLSCVEAKFTFLNQQGTSVKVHDIRTPEATVGVQVGMLVMYLHDADIAQQFARVWSDAERHVRTLPRAGNGNRTAAIPGMSHPAVAVHFGGYTVAYSELVEPKPRESDAHLRVRFGSITMDVLDTPAFYSVRDAFLQAEREAVGAFVEPLRLPSRRLGTPELGLVLEG
jgi:hypothetical protein